jgi:hypothetical protein
MVCARARRRGEKLRDLSLELEGLRHDGGIGVSKEVGGGFWGKGNARQALERKKSRDSSIEVS